MQPKVSYHAYLVYSVKSQLNQQQVQVLNHHIVIVEIALLVAVVVVAVEVVVIEKIVQQQQVQKLKSRTHSVNLNHHASLRNLESRMKIVVSVHNVVSAKIRMHLQQRKHY
jgi:hypothetical protein